MLSQSSEERMLLLFLQLPGLCPSAEGCCWKHRNEGIWEFPPAWGGQHHQGVGSM